VRGTFVTIIFFLFSKKALTVLQGPLAYPNGLLDLHIETFGRTPWPGDQPYARLVTIIKPQNSEEVCRMVSISYQMYELHTTENQPLRIS
jgi:hypothetical protein